jgi:anti-repressor protein
MKELIKITEKEGRQIISARELHEFLESKQQFANWIENRIVKYGLIENQDFIRFNNLIKTGGLLKEIGLTIDIAKELSMVEGNEKGKQARQYFIRMEKVANKPMNQFEFLQMQLDLMKEQAKRIDAIESKIQTIEQKQIGTGEIQNFTIMGYCNNIKKQISLDQAKIYGQKCSKLCTQMGFQTGKVPDPRYGSVKTYPVDVLKEIIK